jgi:hypothetical protein
MFKAKEFPLVFKQKENPDKISEENLQAISLTKRHQDTLKKNRFVPPCHHKASIQLT